MAFYLDLLQLGLLDELIGRGYLARPTVGTLHADGVGDSGEGMDACQLGSLSKADVCDRPRCDTRHLSLRSHRADSRRRNDGPVSRADLSGMCATRGRHPPRAPAA